MLFVFSFTFKLVGENQPSRLVAASLNEIIIRFLVYEYCTRTDEITL